MHRDQCLVSPCFIYHSVRWSVHGVYLFVHGVLMGEVAAVAEGIVLRADVLYGVGDREFIGVTGYCS